MNAQTAAQTASHRFLTFRIDEQLYALRSDDVTEVIRVPAVARVPQSPMALLGLANLRGSVLPVAGLREMLGKKAMSELSTARAIVLDIGARVALVVDSVANLESISPEQIETNQKEIGAEGGVEKLQGAFCIGASRQIAKILDVRAMLESAFSSLGRSKQQQRKPGIGTRVKTEAAAKQTEMLVTFEVAGQEFALPLDAVQEILSLPPALTAVARAEAVVFGHHVRARHAHAPAFIARPARVCGESGLEWTREGGRHEARRRPNRFGGGPSTCNCGCRPGAHGPHSAGYRGSHRRGIAHQVCLSRRGRQPFDFDPLA